MSETLLKRPEVSSSVWEAVKSYASVLTDHRYMIFWVGSVLSVIVSSQPDYFLAAHLGNNFRSITLLGTHIYGQRMLSIMIIVNTIMIVLLMGISNHWTRNWSLIKGYTLGALLQGIGFAMSFILNDFWPLVFTAAVYTIGEMFIVPSSQTLRAEMMDESKLGAYSGAFSVTRPVGSILAGAMVTLSHYVNNIGLAALLLLITGGSIWLTNVASKMPAHQNDVL